MSRGNYARCKYCGRHRDEVGEISWAGYCSEHGKAVRNAANDQMHYHWGPVFDKWRAGMAACVGGVLPDKTEA